MTDCVTISEGPNPVNQILPSLIAFLDAGVRPRTALARAIVVVLILKLMGIATIKFLAFPSSEQPLVDATAMSRLLGPKMLLP